MVTARIANTPPKTVEMLGISFRNIHEPNKAVTGTRKIKEDALLEPSLLAAKK